MKTIETFETQETWVHTLKNDDTTNVQVAQILQMPKRNLDYEKVANTLVTQLREYLEHSKQKWFVIGVSGWIDSALVSTLCAKTWFPTLVLDMPIHQAQAEVNRAYDHMTWLQNNFPNVERESVNLTSTFEEIKKALPTLSDETARYMAYVNTRSRLRAVTLYALGNEKNYLVAGTGNKVEDYGIWFFTKFGDGAVDISPIGNLYKSEVYALARHLGVIESILQARPTDGLHPNGATDEDQIGATYDELEWAMHEHDAFMQILGEHLLWVHDIKATQEFLETFTGRAKEVMEIYLKRHFANAHKMEMPPVFKF